MLYNEFYHNREYPFWQFGDLDNFEEKNLNLNISRTDTVKETQEIIESDEIVLVSFEESMRHLERHQNFLQHM